MMYSVLIMTAGALLMRQSNAATMDQEFEDWSGDTVDDELPELHPKTEEYKNGHYVWHSFFQCLEYRKSITNDLQKARDTKSTNTPHRLHELKALLNDLTMDEISEISKIYDDVDALAKDFHQDENDRKESIAVIEEKFQANASQLRKCIQFLRENQEYFKHYKCIGTVIKSLQHKLEICTCKNHDSKRGLPSGLKPFGIEFPEDLRRLLFKHVPSSTDIIHQENVVRERYPDGFTAEIRNQIVDDLLYRYVPFRKRLLSLKKMKRLTRATTDTVSLANSVREERANAQDLVDVLKASIVVREFNWTTEKERLVIKQWEELIKQSLFLDLDHRQ